MKWTPLLLIFLIGCATTDDAFIANGCTKIREGFYSCPREVVGMERYKLRHQPELCNKEGNG